MRKWMKNLRLIMPLLFMIILAVSSSGYAQSEVDISIGNNTLKVRSVITAINGKELKSEVPAYIMGDRTMVPVRFVAEGLGATVNWENETKTVTITHGGKKVSLGVDNTGVIVDGELKRLEPNEVPKLITFKDLKETRTMVPARFVSEVLGYDVGWDAKTYTVLINNKIDIELPIISEELEESNESVSPNLNPNIAVISSISAVRNGDTIEVKSDGSVEYRTMFIPSSSKFVIDFQDSQLNISGLYDTPGDFELEGINVTRLQYSQFTSDPHSTRIAITLKNEEKPKITTKNNGLTTVITFRGIENPNRGDGRDDIEVDEKNSKDENSSEIDEIPVDETIGGIDYPMPDTEYKPEVLPGINNGKKTIMIDPGHGGSDSGAHYDGVKEKDINLTTSLKLEEALKDAGYNVLMTRTEDVTLNLRDRPEIANFMNIDIFISMHVNAVLDKEDIVGLEVLYAPANEVSIKTVDQYPLAKAVHDNIVEQLQRYSRGIKKRPDLVVLNKSKMPAILVEIGFMSNVEELQLVQDDEYQNKVVKGIVNGVIEYFND